MRLNKVYVILVQIIFLVIISDSDCLNTGPSCKTPNQEDGICKSLYSCDAIIDGIATKNPTALKFALESNCGCDQRGPLVCCGRKSSYVETSTKAAYKEIDPKSLLPSRYICGRQSKDDRVETRGSTQIDEYPWMALLLFNVSHGACAGTLINRRYILTAAHCLENKLTVTGVRLGEYDTSTNGTDCVENPDYDECTEPPIDFEIEESIIHEKYHRWKKINDIALIRLAKDVRYSDYIRPICLPDETSQLSKVGDTLITSGWGLSSYVGVNSEIKKNSKNKRISLEECKKKIENRNVLITTDEICADGLHESGVCQGDSGGPLMFSYKYQWTIEGVVSFGKSCGVGATTVFSYIPNYMDWILSKLKP